MKNKEKPHSKTLHLISLTFVCLISISSVVLAADSQLKDSKLTTETEVSSGGSVDTLTTELSVDNPTGSVAAIYRDRIVWMDNRNGKNDLYMYDLSTNKETKITTTGSASNPAFFGDRIVWQDSRNGNWDIYMYDLSIQKETQITATGSAFYPDIYGDRIVWEDHKNLDIYMFNVSTSEKTPIATSGNAHNPAIYNNRIVWLDGRNGKSDIYMYDLSIQKETQISTSGKASVWNNGFDSSGLAIYGDRIVWQEDDYSGNSDIYMYSLSTQKETKITNSESASHPAIYGNRLVWIDSQFLQSLHVQYFHFYRNSTRFRGISGESCNLR